MNKKIKKIITITMCLGLVFSNSILVKADTIDGTQTYQNQNDVPSILQQNNKNYRLQITKQINYNEAMPSTKLNIYNVWQGNGYGADSQAWQDQNYVNSLVSGKIGIQDNHSFPVYGRMIEIEDHLTSYCALGWPRGIASYVNGDGQTVLINEDPFIGYGGLRAGQQYNTSIHTYNCSYVNTVFYGVYNEIADKTKPIISASQSPTNDVWTNKDVTISYVAKDNQNLNDMYEEVSGIKEIDKLNNDTNQWEKINDNSDGSFTVPQNGDYSLRAIDNVGNVSDTVTVGVRNIDKQALQIEGADDYVQDTTSEIAGSPKTINIDITDKADNLGLYSGLSNIKLIDTTNNSNNILVNKDFEGEQTTNINYVNNVEGIRNFEIVATDRAGNITTKIFKQDIKPKLQILSLSNVCRVYGIDEIDNSEHLGPVNPALKILSGTKGTMKVETRGAYLIEAEFYCNNEPINGIQFESTNEMVQYSNSYITYYNPDNINVGDNKDDNKITLKASDPYTYPYNNQNVSFSFILPNTGENAVKKGSVISIKVIAYNQTGNVINNEIGKEFFVVSDDVRNCIKINNIR